MWEKKLVADLKFNIDFSKTLAELANYYLPEKEKERLNSLEKLDEVDEYNLAMQC